jgi:acyl dehydratase
VAVRELESSPRMRTLYPRAVAGSARHGVRRLPGLGNGRRSLPELKLALRDVAVEREHLVEYDRVCGYAIRDVLPATYPHVMAFPLSMKLMTDASFPFPVMGLVHVRNRIEQLRPVRADESLHVELWADDLREHDRGTQFDVVADVAAGGEPVWRGFSTYLHKERSSGDKGGGERPAPPPVKAVWPLPRDIGRRYAAVSGDRNPIHLRKLSARLFGMKGPIAHGMWLKARCLAALEGALPDGYEVDVRFKLPAYLPGKVSFGSWRESGGRGFALHDEANEKPHLSGTLK